MSWQLFGLAVATLVAVASVTVNILLGQARMADDRSRTQRDKKDIEIKGRAQDNADDAQVLSVAQVNITMLEKQNELLTKTAATAAAQGEQREADWRAREEEWRREKRNFESRISDLERSYKTLVAQVNEMGVCIAFDTCKDFKSPSGRRSVKVGGTDA